MRDRERETRAARGIPKKAVVMIRLGKFYFGWAKPERELRYLPELIICHNEKQAQRIRQTLAPDAPVRVVTPHISQLRGRVYAKVTVLPGIDLDQDVDGAGSLRSILEHQLMWGARAILIVL